MLIIGRGMMANAFRAADDEGVLVFASGVSNSSETGGAAFAREVALLIEAIERNPDKKLVYFSSCAADSVDTPYYRHKRAMELLVEERADRFLVCRLPQVVGHATNDTLVSHIARKLAHGEPILVNPGARRSLIDVEDVARIVRRLLPLDSMHVRIGSGRVVTIEELIDEIASVLGATPVLRVGTVESGKVDYDASALKTFLGAHDPIFAEGYRGEVLRKYLQRVR